MRKSTKEYIKKYNEEAATENRNRLKEAKRTSEDNVRTTDSCTVDVGRTTEETTK